jgi:hypothetical protein
MDHLYRFIFNKLALFVAAIVIFSAAGASANPGRAVYVNGKVHRIYGHSGSYIKHVTGQPRNASDNDWVFVGEGEVQVSPWCASWKYMNGSGLAVFDNKIFYSYTSHSSCQGTAMYAYVGAFDLTTNSWTTLKRLGSVRTDLDSEGAGAGAAITVFDNKLYVFTDSGTYTSGDGINWSSSAALVPGGEYQPLDAVTYYPPDAAPRILIVYGSPDLVWGPANYYTKLSSATWNGQFGTGSDFPSTPSVLFNHWVYRGVALQPGTLGALEGFIAGATTPSVQLFFQATASDGTDQIRRAEFTYSAASPGGSWRVDSYVFEDGDLSDLWIYPWYTVACDSDHLEYQARQQTIAVNYHSGEERAFAGTSDFMVPVNNDIQPGACGDWNYGTSTDTDAQTDSPEAATLRKYWSLYGVILGSPPFAHNNALPNEVAKLSNVNYGQYTKNQVQHSQSWDKISMFSAGLEVRAGLLDKFGVQDKADISYIHGLENEEETSYSSTTGYGTTIGTDGENAEDLENLGRIGWAIFGVPKVIVQDFSLYAYDYNFYTGLGTALDQNVHVVEVSPTAVSVIPYAFELENPGGSEDDIPGLLSGIEPFPRSTDLEGWHSQSWESMEMPWEVVFGDGTYLEPSINVLTFTNGVGSDWYLTDATQKKNSEGETTKVEINNQASIDVGTRLEGFKLDLKAGYDSIFKTTVTNTTELGNAIQLSLHPKPCETSGPGCVKTLYVQPYFLMAEDETAPWVPTAYAGQKPWCITWRVKDYTMDDGTKSGLSAPPDLAEGLIVGEQGEIATSVDHELSWYSIKGAHLGWVNSRGKMKRIPMNAIKFDPAKGVTVELNGYVWSSIDAEGRWTRHGNVWTFESHKFTEHDKTTMKLDFGKKTWDFNLSLADLSECLPPVSGDVHVALIINEKYTMRSDLRHDVKTEWRWQRLPGNQEALALTLYEGQYDSISRKGWVTMAGILPETLETFGDMSIEVNDHLVHVPLLELFNFHQALENEGTLIYEQGGLNVEVDITSRTWIVNIESEAFNQLQAPLRGNALIRVLVGGVSWGSFDVPVVNFRSQLWLAN